MNMGHNPINTSPVCKRPSLEKKDFSGDISHTSLLSLGEKLELSSKQRVRYNGFVFRLTDTIQDRVQVARFYVSGSYGRRVTVFMDIPKTVGLDHVEIDLVVFLRNPDYSPSVRSSDSLIIKLHSSLVKDFSDFKEIKVLPLISPGCSLENGTQPATCCKNKATNHRCCEDFISVQIEEANFRIFLAPSLGQTSEEQRQATYKRMQELFLSQRKKGLPSQLHSWNAALVEKPSEEMANAGFDQQAFIRVCQLWIHTNKIHSLQCYAVEVLALLIAKKTSGQQQQQSGSNDDSVKFDLVTGFLRFLSYCADLKSVRQLCEIESPATYVSPFSDYPTDIPILMDRFNPYCNLLESLTPEDQQQLSSSAKYTLKLLPQKDAVLSRAVLLEQIFTPTPRIHSQSIFKSIARFLQRILLIFIVCMGIYLGLSWRKAGDSNRLIESISNDMDRLYEQLLLWRVIGTRVFNTIYQLITQKILRLFVNNDPYV